MPQSLFTWAGTPAGHISNGNVFDSRNAWIGWIEGQEVWSRNGQFLGELIDGSYIMKRTAQMPRMAKMPRMAPIPPMPPMPAMPRMPRMGYVDVLGA